MHDSNYQQIKQHELLEKPLPSAFESERTVLGAVLIDNNLFESLADKPFDLFYSPTHKNVFQAMKSVWAQSRPIDPITVGEELSKLGQLEVIGGVPAITKLTYGLPHFGNLDTYLAPMNDALARRKSIIEAQRFINSMLEFEPIEASFESFVETVDNSIKTGSVSEPSLMRIGDIIPHQLSKWQDYLNPNKEVCIATGIAEIDNQLTGGGLAKGLYHVIAGFPAMGKSSFALDIVGHTLLQGKSVVFFTIELSKEILLNRLCSPFADIPRYMIASNKLTEHYYNKLTQVLTAFQKLPFWVDDKSNNNASMNQSLRKVAKKTGGEIDLIVVDYVQRMVGDGFNEHQIVKGIVNQHAQWAKEYNACVVDLSQFKRVGDDKRTGQRPQMSWLKESGSLEETARTILGIWQTSDQFQSFESMKRQGEKGVKPVTISCIKQGEGAEFDYETCFLTDCLTFGVRQKLI